VILALEVKNRLKRKDLETRAATSIKVSGKDHALFLLQTFPHPIGNSRVIVK
jgi:hypothetical protein